MKGTTFVGRLGHFLGKPAQKKMVTIRYFLRRGLSRLPYLPARMRLRVSPGEDVFFWWSHIPAPFQPARALFDYWGDDVGELRFLWRFLRPAMVFLDVGSYHGLYALLAARRVGRQGTVVAFEPSPRERRRLRLHLRLNRDSKVRVEPTALGAETGTARFFVVVSGFTSMNSMRRPAAEGAVEEIAVHTEPLDAYLERAGLHRADLLKVDAEGGERDVFKGAAHTLRALRPLIICEVLDWVTAPWGYPAREIVSCLESFDYVWFEFQPDGRLVPHMARQDYPEVCNYLAVPREKLLLVDPWLR